MAEQLASDTGADAVAVSEAFAMARELLRRAQADAARLRADADRYVRQHEQEAELLIGKARHLLAVAEQRAVDLVAARATADAGREEAPDPTPSPPSPQTIDLNTAPAPRKVEEQHRIVPTALDGILASAVAKAVDRSFRPES